MPDAQSGLPRITAEQLKGLNERNKDANLDLGYFDILKGFVPTSENTLTKINGTKTLHFRPGEKILGFCQTNDSRQNIIVQTNIAEYMIGENEFFAHPLYDPDLTINATLVEEDTMARAVLVHSTASGVSGGTYTTANVWQQAPISAILTQLNADGTAAAFCALAANQFTLQAGVYRLRGWSMMFCNVSATNSKARIYNVTAAAAAWPAAANENSFTLQGGLNTCQRNLQFAGDITLAGPTVFEIQGFMTNAQTASGFGLNGSFTGSQHLYRWLEILKTA